MSSNARRGGPQTPRRYRDDAVLELEDLGEVFRVMRTALKKFERALDGGERRNNTARGKLRKAQVLEDQLAFWTPGMDDRRGAQVLA